MKNYKILSLAVLLTFATIQANAQQNSEIDQLKTQLRQMQDNFERVQREQREQIDALTKKLDSLTQPASTATAAPTNTPAKTDEQKKLEQELAAELGPVTNAPAPATLTKSAWTPSQPIPVMRAGN